MSAGPGAAPPPAARAPGPARATRPAPPGGGPSPLRRRAPLLPGAPRLPPGFAPRRARRARSLRPLPAGAANASGGGGGGASGGGGDASGSDRVGGSPSWLRPLEGLARQLGVTIYQAPAPPPVAPGAKVDFLEAMLQWHLGNDTSAELVLREVQDAIVQEVTSFPVDKVSVGESPSVAMHVPVAVIREAQRGPPPDAAAMANAARNNNRGANGRGAANADRTPDESTPLSSAGRSAANAASDDALLRFPEWEGWTEPSVALTLRAVLMTASALTAAAGMQQPMIGIAQKTDKRGDEKSKTNAGDESRSAAANKARRGPQILFPAESEGDDVLSSSSSSSSVEATRLREFFETLWPDAPYAFGTYDRTSVNSDTKWFRNIAADEDPDEEDPEEEPASLRKKIGGRIARDASRRAWPKGEKRLVLIVNVSSPGDEFAAESDGEGMVNCAETLLELGVPFVVLTLWKDDALKRSVASGKSRVAEQEALRVRMERRTRILLGRSVKRKEARDAVRAAFAEAKRSPQGAGYVALEEALAEARAAGVWDAGGDGAAMLREIRRAAREEEQNALADALRGACLQVPVDVAGLRANLVRARGMLETVEAEARMEKDAESVLIDGEEDKDEDEEEEEEENATKAGAEEEDGERRGVADASAEDDDDDGVALPEAGSVLGSMEDIDRFTNASGGDAATRAAGDLVGGGGLSTNAAAASPLAALKAATISAEAALEAAELESDLRVALQDESSLAASAVPRLEALMLRAAKTAARKPPLTQEGAAKLNTLVSRCFTRAVALQEMESARAQLAEALEPSLRGADLAVGPSDDDESGGWIERRSRGSSTADGEASTPFSFSRNIPALEKAVARAKSSAWPWQLEDAVGDAETVLERWKAASRVEEALRSRDVARIRREISYATKQFPALDCASAEDRLATLDAERNLEGGDQRLRAYFAASKMARAGGREPDAEATQMLATIRASLQITDAEHEQVTKAASAGSRTEAEAARAEAMREAEEQTRGGDANTFTAGSSGGGESGGQNQNQTTMNRVSFAASGRGVRGPMFEGSNEDAIQPVTELYVLNWDDPEVELYVGGAGPREGFAGFTGTSYDAENDVNAAGFDRNASGNGSDSDPGSRAWARAVPDEGSAGEAVGEPDESSVSSEGGGGGGGSSGGSSASGARAARGGERWRRVGDAIIYNEEEIIGVGSSGTYVFRGYVQHTTRAKHAVAVKRIQRPPGEEGRELLKLVEREVELLTALNQSPRVPFFHCWGITSSHVFIALELCSESLREHVARQGAGMAVERRFEILRSVAAGIEWLHDAEKPSGCITHNDLKPENLLVDSAGAVKIADVGLGVQLRNRDPRAGGKRSGRGDASSDQYTMSTFRKYGIDIVLAGRAPEMLKREPLTPAADIWAMGVVFYFVLTGRASPFSASGKSGGQSDESAIIDGRHRLQPLMSVRGLVPRRALEARHLLASMLAPDPAERPAAAEVTSHPLFWDDERAMEEATKLHARSASLQRDLGSMLADVSTEALLSRNDGGNAERGALLAAAGMELTDWKRAMDDRILTRITAAHVTTGVEHHRPDAAASANNAAGGSRADVGRRPYGDGFGDLLRFCRNANEHPPTADEIAPMVDALVSAGLEFFSREKELLADEKAHSRGAKKSKTAAAAGGRRTTRRGGSVAHNSDGSSSTDGSSSSSVDEDDPAEDSSEEAAAEEEARERAKLALLPPGVRPGMAYRRLTREQRKRVFAAYATLLFPTLPLAVYEMRRVAGADDELKSEPTNRGARRGRGKARRGKRAVKEQPSR